MAILYQFVSESDRKCLDPVSHQTSEKKNLIRILPLRKPDPDLINKKLYFSLSVNLNRENNKINPTSYNFNTRYYS